MIEQTVNSILEAEDEAKRRIAAAENQAADIVNQGEIAAEAIVKEAAQQNKVYLAEQNNLIDQQAADVASQFLAQSNAAADKQLEQYAANVDKAVKIILEQL